MPKCWLHLQRENHLQIMPSTINGAGSGLFVRDPLKSANDIIFWRGDKIVDYLGERITREQLDARYGQYTAPYAIGHGRDFYEDSACFRGAGSLINHKPRQFANVAFHWSDAEHKFEIYATRNIRNFSELFVDYGREYELNEPTSYRTSRTSRRR